MPRWLFWKQPPAPPPPPPPPQSLHLSLSATSDQFIAASAACAVLAVLILVAAWFLWRSKPAAKKVPLVTVEEAASAKGRIAVLSDARPGSADTTLVHHIRRLLLQRGFQEVRTAKPSELDEKCRGAHLVVDLAIEAPEGAAAAGTEALLRTCSAHGVRNLIQCSDALVGYDASTDVCDGDELSDPGISLISPEPRPPPIASNRLNDLCAAEEALARHVAATDSCAAIVLRLHRVYSVADDCRPVPPLPAAARPSQSAPSDAHPPLDTPARRIRPERHSPPQAEPLDLERFPALLLSLLLASGGGMALGCARAQTNLLHVEDAALGVTLAADHLLGGEPARGEPDPRLPEPDPRLPETGSQAARTGSQAARTAARPSLAESVA